LFREACTVAAPRSLPYANWMKKVARCAAEEPECPEKIATAARELMAAGGEHAMLDTAGVVAVFATITIIVDATGHRYPPARLVAIKAISWLCLLRQPRILASVALGAAIITAFAGGGVSRAT